MAKNNTKSGLPGKSLEKDLASVKKNIKNIEIKMGQIKKKEIRESGSTFYW